MSHDQDVDRARRAIEKERTTADTHTAALEARDDAVNRALESAPDDMSDNALARRLGLSPSTFRSITAEQRRQRRATRK